jgi:hypothetical protein
LQLQRDSILVSVIRTFFGDGQSVFAIEKNINKVIGALKKIAESFQMIQLAELLA